VKKRRVLVIDDEKAIRETLSEILADEGYAVTSIESGEEGLKRLREENFDLAFPEIITTGTSRSRPTASRCSKRPTAGCAKSRS